MNKNGKSVLAIFRFRLRLSRFKNSKNSHRSNRPYGHIVHKVLSIKLVENMNLRHNLLCCTVDALMKGFLMRVGQICLNKMLNKMNIDKMCI